MLRLKYRIDGELLYKFTKMITGVSAPLPQNKR
jgi:hypothetical protein